MHITINGETKKLKSLYIDFDDYNQNNSSTPSSETKPTAVYFVLNNDPNVKYELWAFNYPTYEYFILDQIPSEAKACLYIDLPSGSTISPPNGEIITPYDYTTYEYTITAEDGITTQDIKIRFRAVM